ncbi:hypothetical protein [Streptomyces sp. CA-111067]|uniref:hypothetical protein n=1 Tax=Streptomyces sp. CA-111067 TaxID=3240046 RepID=UPI003D98F065
MGIFSGRRRAARRTGFDRPGPARVAAVDYEVEQARRLIAEGRPTEAEQQLVALLLDRQAALSGDDPRLYDTRLAYAAAVLGLGRRDEAAAMFDATVDECSGRFGAGHPQTLLAIVRRAEGRAVAGRPEEAAADTQAVLAECAGGTYAGHTVALVRTMARQVNAVAVGQAGRHREALAAYDAMLPDLARQWGAESAAVLVCRANRVQQLAVLGQFREAEGEALALLATAGRLADTGAAADALTLSAAAANGLAFTLTESGRAGEAELELRAPLARMERREGQGGQFVSALRLNLVNSLNAQGRFDEALAEAELLPADDPRQVGGPALARAEALHGLGRTEEAERAAEEALSKCAAAYSPVHSRVLRARTLLATIQTSPADLASAAADWHTHFGPTHPRTLAAQAAADALTD